MLEKQPKSDMICTCKCPGWPGRACSHAGAQRAGSGNGKIDPCLVFARSRRTAGGPAPSLIYSFIVFCRSQGGIFVADPKKVVIGKKHYAKNHPEKKHSTMGKKLKIPLTSFEHANFLLMSAKKLM